MKQVFLIILMLFVMATPALAKVVNLQWDASPSTNVAGYTVCYSSLPAVLVEGQVVPTEGMVPTCDDAGNVLTYSYPDLMDEAIYYFGIVAYNEVGQQSVLSNIVMSQGFAAPEPPGGLLGQSTVNTVDVPLQ